MSAGADFSLNCLGCEHLRTELWPLRGGRGKETVAYRCFAPGPCRGWHMGTGLILPYIPVDPEPVLVIEGEGDERFYSEEEGVLVGRQARFEEESAELPVAFVRHRCDGRSAPHE